MRIWATIRLFVRPLPVLLPILATAFLAVAGPHLRAHAGEGMTSITGIAMPASSAAAQPDLPGLPIQSAGLPTPANAAGGGHPAATDGAAKATAGTPPASVLGVQLADQGRQTRFVLEMTAAASFDLYLLSGPPRAVVDFSGLDWAADDGSGAGKGLIAEHRHGLFDGGTMRVVLDLTGPAAVRDVFFLPGTDYLPYRFVLDLEPTDPATFAGLVVDPGSSPATSPMAPPTVAPAAGQGAAMSATLGIPEPPIDAPPRRTVVLDAGHGGIDPGATGVSGQHEKHVTLDMAMRVAALLEDRGGYRVVLTRETDTYVRLRERVAIARREAADLFLSLHADSYPEPWLRGASVYTVSDRASDRAAALLAERENAADAIAGIQISHSDDATASILIDLATRQARADSLRMADLLVDHLGRETQLIPDAHRHAGFVVLKAPDVPSVLVELGYLSNDEDDRLLGTAEYRDRLARTLVRAIEAYFDEADAVARG